MKTKIPVSLIMIEHFGYSTPKLWEELHLGPRDGVKKYRLTIEKGHIIKIQTLTKKGYWMRLHKKKGISKFSKLPSKFGIEKGLVYLTNPLRDIYKVIDVIDEEG